MIQNVFSQMRKVNLVMCLLILCLQFSHSANAKVETVIGGVPLSVNLNLTKAIPSSASNEIIISRDQYVISYNKTRRAPNWVAWRLTANQIGNSGRTNNFLQDPDLENYLVQSGSGKAVDPSEYTGSCFDRGHQIPSDDRTDNVTDNDATFLMSNMIPQTPFLNRIAWEHLEQYTRNLVQQSGKQVFVIAGPIYDTDFGAIGPQRDIPVPSKDFKIIIVLDANQKPSDINQSTTVIAVVMPNTLQGGKKPVPYTKNCGGAGATALVGGSVDDWQQYKTTVADIEKLSKLAIPVLHP